jgi:hypothetical protein
MNHPDTKPEVCCCLSDGANKRKKSVRIDPLVEIRDDCSTSISEAERFQGWWQHDEYEVTKSAARSMCRQMRRMGNTNNCLSDAYDRACSIAADANVDLETSCHSANEVRMATEL